MHVSVSFLIGDSETTHWYYETFLLRKVVLASDIYSA